jgi:prepilin-type N-terminal cleavage/methylation domain-containing protein
MKTCDAGTRPDAVAAALATAPRSGFSLVELTVAMTILAVGILALAGTASHAQRAFAHGAATEKVARVAAAVIDSLLTEPRPTAGMRESDNVRLRWTVTEAGGLIRIFTTVEVHDGASMVQYAFRSARVALAAQSNE